ncbi:hypothetical protein B0A49_13173 [Cryomyces minteri]|uniref:Uncharacterized protein n=1 Tax=Cryomyces minteri TaxID=331657 RepID=A0A4U0VLQ2_9PEZI|nr:hypothetical protein B0A49_13173 [Cryomyces minteri]
MSSAAASPSQPVKPSSRSPHRKHRSHGSDPFLELPLTPSPSPKPVKTQAQEKEQLDPLWTRVIVSPLLFLSFILSLFLVNRRDRQWRVQQHPSPAASSIWGRLSPRAWIDPEPYQDPTDSTWQRTWYSHKKHRKMMKLEFSDAFEMRGQMIAIIISAAVLGLVSLIWSVKRMFAWWQ